MRAAVAALLALAVSSANATLTLCNGPSGCTIQGGGGAGGGGNSVVPIPAAAWLFGSGLLGLAGVSRKRRQTPA